MSEDDKPSKSALKRQATEMQKLGEELLEFPDEELDRLITDERLRTALRDLRRFTSHGARYRQAQYVGKLMRNADMTPLEAAVITKRAAHVREVTGLRDITMWRDRLVAGDEGLTAWLARDPDSDTPEFRAMVRDARRDRKHRAFTELFRTVKARLEKLKETSGRRS
jgi:ribosome-associated protein